MSTEDQCKRPDTIQTVHSWSPTQAYSMWILGHHLKLRLTAENAKIPK